MKHGPSENTNEPIHDAAINGNVRVIKQILKKNIKSLNIQNNDGVTALHLAVQEGNLAAVKELVQQGAELNIYDYYGRLPIEYTSEEDIKQFLLERGASIPNLWTELHKAAEEGNITLIHQLFENDKTLLHAVDYGGYTPLIYAIFGGQFEAVKVLVAHGARLDLVDKAGYPPMYHAQDDLKIKEWLLEQGAEECDDKFVPVDKSNTKLHDAAKAGDIYGIRKIIKNEEDLINFTNRAGETPLQLAIFSKKYDAAIELVKRGSDLSVVNSAGLTPLHKAIQADNLPLIATLLDKGADFDVVDYAGVSPLQLAIMLEQYDIAIELIKRGCNVNIVDSLGQTPLHISVNAGHFGLIEILLDQGADVNVVDDFGFSPLDIAISNGKSEVVQFLMKYNPNLERVGSQTNIVERAKNEMRHTPLSKYLKRKIEISKNSLSELENNFRQLLMKEMACAKNENKKILIILGEIHGDYKIYQLEKAMLKVASECGISVLYAEASTIEAADFPVQLKSQTKYNMSLEAVDTHPDRDNASVEERNVYIAKEINAKNEDGIFITGGEHLYGLLQNIDSKINPDQFRIIPFNLMRTEATEKSDDSEFALNNSYIIQLSEPYEDFSPFSHIIEKWNPTSQIKSYENSNNSQVYLPSEKKDKKNKTANSSSKKESEDKKYNEKIKFQNK